MSDIIEKIRKEWTVISGAPWSLVTVVVVVGVLVYGFMNLINAASFSARDASPFAALAVGRAIG
ncbi:MAG TPA: hypothetical protein VMI72_05620 [Roseiarcus sp.]|nr:hypothetical protein [Roseiarcus sp.]